MASSDNLASIEPWMMYGSSTFADSYLPDAFTTNKQHQPIIHNNMNYLSSVYSDGVSPFFNLSELDTTPFTPTLSHVSGSEPDSPAAPLRPRGRNGSSMATVPPPPSGKVTKRKSRASKRCQTTFITADPANFRQMVQLVTGVRFNGRSNTSHVPVGSLLQPEQKRASNYGHLQQGGSLPTLDSSSHFLEYQQNSSSSINGTGSMGGSGHVAGRGPTVMTSEAGFDFEGFSSFPTLESWKVM